MMRDDAIMALRLRAELHAPALGCDGVVRNAPCSCGDFHVWYCVGCGQRLRFCNGGDDELPEHCDRCWWLADRFHFFRELSAFDRALLARVRAKRAASPWLKARRAA